VKTANLRCGPPNLELTLLVALTIMNRL